MLINGEKYWCIKHSIESENYQDPSKSHLPLLPWQGTLKDQYLYRNINDDDSNSKAFVQQGDLFDTAEEATKAFISACQKHIKSLL